MKHHQPSNVSRSSSRTRFLMTGRTDLRRVRAALHQSFFRRRIRRHARRQEHPAETGTTVLKLFILAVFYDYYYLFVSISIVNVVARAASRRSGPRASPKWSRGRFLRGLGAPPGLRRHTRRSGCHNHRSGGRGLILSWRPLRFRRPRRLGLQLRQT